MGLRKGKGDDETPKELTLGDIFPWMREDPVVDDSQAEGIDMECPRCETPQLITENTPSCMNCDEASAY